MERVHLYGAIPSRGGVVSRLLASKGVLLPWLGYLGPGAVCSLLRRRWLGRLPAAVSAAGVGGGLEGAAGVVDVVSDEVGMGHHRQLGVERDAGVGARALGVLGFGERHGEQEVAGRASGMGSPLWMVRVWMVRAGCRRIRTGVGRCWVQGSGGRRTPGRGRREVVGKWNAVGRVRRVASGSLPGTS